MATTGSRYKKIRVLSGTGRFVVAQYLLEDIVTDGNPREVVHATAKLCGNCSVFLGRRFFIRPNLIHKRRPLLRMIFIAINSVAILRHQSDFIEFFCDVMEPNANVIRVFIETYQALE